MGKRIPKSAAKGSDKRRKDTARRYYQGGFRI